MAEKSTFNGWKLISVFLVGMILGFMIDKLPLFEKPTFTFSEAEKTRILGNVNAKVKIVEYSDFQCPFCKKFIDESYPEIKKNYLDTGKAVLIYKDYPLTSIHPQAFDAAVAGQCAAEQNKFWPMHDALFAGQNEWSQNAKHQDIFRSYAQKIGMDTTKYDSCMNNTQTKAQVEKEMSEGVDENVEGTPTLIINGRSFVGFKTYNELASAIDSALSKK